MADDVRERLLQNAEYRQLPRAIRHFLCHSPGQPAPNARARFEPGRRPFNRFSQPQMVQYGRSEVARDLANRLDADFDQAYRRLEFIDELNTRLGLVVPQLVNQPHEFELEAREHLPELVMQLACDPRALFLACLLQSKREGMEVTPRCATRRAPRRAAPRPRSLHFSSEVLLIA